MRKIIQVAVESDPGTKGDVIALCNDGTLWSFNYINHLGRSGWKLLPPIPQTILKNDKADE